ncbi:DJ-1/PfpI family protein [Aminobacter sp. J44]|uniref:DJ-1/PfpI family protein n=1 Tax=Aminobacter sp. J44 TaxID=935262 RepID=UPI00119AFEE7|nr:DJ-1/PfpI family protein [Aminobacter sp. J44]TWG65879.1 Transcriptional regulator containing an amidase domain and an AraC-type DNA-binding HTH domain [Aminobacter sp. J44]
MRKSYLLWGILGLVALALAGFGGWLLTLPNPVSTAAPDVPPSETEAMLASLKPPKRERPLVAIIGINDATETTDYMMPAGILRRADVADVVMLATDAGPVKLYPALTVEPDATIAEFDAAHPEGADYVIVPAMSRDDDPAALEWIRSQADKGANIVAVCAGAKVLAAAGLLEGKRATSHWYYLERVLELSPTAIYVPDRRIVTDGKVTTTTGISASMPMMLTLIEAIAGRYKAEEIARDLGVEAWDTRHASGAFRITRPFATTVLTNRLAFWRNEELGIRLQPGIDEVSLALIADAWSRTYRSSVSTIAGSSEPIESLSGLRLIPDQAGAVVAADHIVPTFPNRPPAVALDETLAAIAARYGERTMDVVAMQLEYPQAQENMDARGAGTN